MIDTTYRRRLLGTSMMAGAALLAASALMVSPAMAQDAAQDEETELDVIVVTGSRIQSPGLVSASPIQTLGAEEISLQQTAEVEQIIRDLPIAQPGDGDAVNNGTAGVSTVNLRGLGANRNLILIDGKRVTPYNIDGIVDVSGIPTAFLERIDIITGGASAVYGSDAISGALNFILKNDFEGVEFSSGHSMTGEEDGQTYSANLAIGANTADGRGNVALNLNYNKREGVQLAARPLGNVGIDTASGANYSSFLAGNLPAAPADPLCGGPGAVAAGGSTTTVPTRTQITGIGTSAAQFRSDGTLGPNCSVFNFNPFNYYQTPLERFGGLALGSYEINDHIEVYARASFTSTSVRQQIAPSGIFGNSYFVPLANPYLGTQARTTLINSANAARLLGDGSLGANNWRDLNTNGVVDVADDLSLVIRRRTGELGERSTTYNNDYFQIVLGVRGEIFDGWNYDISYQRGESDRSNVVAGYTNIANFGNAINAVSTTTCRTGGSACVPVNVFGGFGSITPQQAAYIGATAIERQSYVQQLATATIGGVLNSVKSPWASEAVAVNFGVEYREENAVTTPDECLKLAPASCLGGAGGNTLPVAGGFSVGEVFGEAFVPLLSDVPLAHSLDLELGYRYSDFDPSGPARTYKIGLSYAPVEDFRIRLMQQRAARAPNVGELAAPQVSGLRNATSDPCSLTNAGRITPTLRALCIGTGQTASQVGTVQDIVSGQIATFEGTDLNALPSIEKADTTTVGFVWTPSFLPEFWTNPVLSLDYYDIEVEDFIGAFSPQETLDQCYISGLANACAKIVRVNGDLASPAAGIQRFTTNLSYLKAEGLEFGATTGLELGTIRSMPTSLDLAFNANYYLANESLSSAQSAVIDCLGYYGTDCGDPTAEFRFVQRTTWNLGPVGLSYLWRYIGGVEIEPDQRAATFTAFREIPAYNYFDLVATWDVNDTARLTLGVENVTDEDPPILGNEAATTSANSGNTLPSTYDTLGRVYSVSLNLRF